MAKATHKLTKKNTVQNREKEYAYKKGDQIAQSEYNKLIKRHKAYFEQIDDSGDESKSESKD